MRLCVLVLALLGCAPERLDPYAGFPCVPDASCAVHAVVFGRLYDGGLTACVPVGDAGAVRRVCVLQ